MEGTEALNFGLIGRSIEYSFSRAFFKEKFEHLNLPHHYQNFDLQSLEELDKVWKTKNLKGGNVTIPYKQEIIAHLDLLSPEAAEIGAVNCIHIEDNKRVGYNTDAYGFLTSFKPLLSTKDQNAIVLGANGGAAKAVIYALESMEIRVTKIGRRSNDEIDFTYDELDEELIESHQIIINCTPLGTHPNVNQKPNIPYHHLNYKHYLFDLVYRPEKTAFLKEGEARGSRICNGSMMLKWQAEKSWEIWNSL
jgi:shikimate dehydrogenase